MDEVDSIGSARSDSGGGGGGGDSEVQRTMLELLNQLDGFEATNKIKVSHANSGCRLLMCVMLELLSQLDGFEATNKSKVRHAKGPCLLMWMMPLRKSR